MLSLAFRRPSIQNQKPAPWPSRLMSMTLCRDGCGWAHAYTIAVGTCLRHVLPRVRRSEARPTSLGVSWTTPRHQHPPQREPAPAESAAVRGGKLQSKGLGFGARCNKPSRLRTLRRHRNVWHAGRRLKRAFRFRKVLWLLSSKESNNKKNLCSSSALCLRHGMGRDAPALCVGLKPRGMKKCR
jgi:hypothetical protein